MADAYCSSCGSSLTPGAQYCGRCGASAVPEASGASDWDATRTDVYSPYRRETAPYGYGQPTTPQPPPAGPPAPPAPPGPAGPRRLSPALMIAVAALAVAVIAVAVTLFVVSTGSNSTPTAGQTPAGTTTASFASGASTASSPAGSPTLAQPQIVTVTRSATLAAPAAHVGSEPIPLSREQLRSVFESGGAVDPDNYADYPDVVFSSPSDNIECAIFVSSESVQCAINRYAFDQPGPDCDNGALFTLDSYGNATYSGCLPTPFAASGNTLTYSASITNGDFGCVSRSVGISCVDLATDTGFTLSREEFVPVN